MIARICAPVAGIVLACASLFASTASAQGYLNQSAREMLPAPDSMPRGPASAASMAALTPNGSFETNGGAGTNVLANWTVVDQAGGNGSWFAQTGTGSPTNMFPVNAPTNGTFAAMTDQGGPGAHVLYQSITIPPQGGTLSFSLFIRNNAAFVNPPGGSLDYTVIPNQQFRADLMNPAATDFDVGAGVVQNLYQTQAGDPATSGYVTVTRSILGNGATRTLRLRFAETDNQGNLAIGIDNVDFTAGAPLNPFGIPTLDWRGLLVMAALLGLLAAGVLRRRAHDSI